MKPIAWPPLLDEDKKQADTLPLDELLAYIDTLDETRAVAVLQYIIKTEFRVMLHGGVKKAVTKHSRYIKNIMRASFDNLTR